MKWRKLNNILHRDIGYFFTFMVLIYALSGIAVNHAESWNPNFVIDKQEVKLNFPSKMEKINRQIIDRELEKIGEKDNYKVHDFPSKNKIKIYFEDGSLLYRIDEGVGDYEKVNRRVLFYEINLLHFDPGGLWTFFSDIFCISLIIMSVTGLFVIKGKNGLSGRGKWIITAGLILTVLFAMNYV